jgi:hypothetical protein
MISEYLLEYAFGSLLLYGNFGLLTVGYKIWFVLRRFKEIWLKDIKRLL